MACHRRLSRSLLDDEECLLRFAVEQSLGQGCVLEPLLFNILFVTVMKAAQTRLKADNDITKVLVQLRKESGVGESRGATAGEPPLMTSLRGMQLATPESSRNRPDSSRRRWA